MLTLHGELDLANSHLLESALDAPDAESAPMLVLDLRDVQFIDSTGLRAILTTHERLHEQGRELAVIPGSEQVQRLFTITRVGEHLRIVASPDELPV